jgi:hypothetical protein
MGNSGRFRPNHFSNITPTPGSHAYPMCRDKSKAENFMAKRIEINRAELPKFLQ